MVKGLAYVYRDEMERIQE